MGSKWFWIRYWSFSSKELFLKPSNLNCPLGYWRTISDTVHVRQRSLQNTEKKYHKCELVLVNRKKTKTETETKIIFEQKFKSVSKQLSARYQSQSCCKVMIQWTACSQLATVNDFYFRKFEIGTPVLNKGIENLKRYNCVSIRKAFRSTADRPLSLQNKVHMTVRTTDLKNAIEAKRKRFLKMILACLLSMLEMLMTTVAMTKVFLELFLGGQRVQKRLLGQKRRLANLTLTRENIIRSWIIYRNKRKNWLILIKIWHSIRKWYF